MAKLPVKKATKSAGGGSPYVSYSDNADDDQEIFLILGKIGSGKTFTAASASEFRTNPSGPEKKMTDLEDMFFCEADSKGTAGLKHNNMKVRRFSIMKVLADKKSITFAIQKFLEEVARIWQPQLKLAIDLTGLDQFMFQDNYRKYKDHTNAFEVYKRNLGDHVILSQDIKALNLHTIYMCHGRAFAGSDDKEVVVKLAGGGEMVPDITGQAPKFYKRDASIQLGIVARKPPKTKQYVRTAYFGLAADEEGIEGKNRYEGLLPESMSPPDLKKVFQLIRQGGKK